MTSTDFIQGYQVSFGELTVANGRHALCLWADDKDDATMYRAFESIAKDQIASGKRFKPQYHLLDQRYHELKPRPSGDAATCDRCAGRGTVTIVMAGRTANRLRPVNRITSQIRVGGQYQAIPPDYVLRTTLIPCLCSIGLSYNARSREYSPEILKALHDRCVLSPLDADNLIASLKASPLMNQVPTDMGALTATALSVEEKHLNE